MQPEMRLHEPEQLLFFAYHAFHGGLYGEFFSTSIYRRICETNPSYLHSVHSEQLGGPGDPGYGTDEEMKINELAVLAISQDLEAFEELFQIFRPGFTMIYSDMLRRFRVYTLDEWLADCRTMLWDAVFRYRTDSQSSLRTFVYKVAKNLALDKIRILSRAANGYEGLSLDELMAERDTMNLAERILLPKKKLNEDIFSDLEFSLLVEQLFSSISETERRIIEMLYLGYNKKEIARILGCGPKRINSALNQCRKIICVDMKYRDC